MSEVRNVNFRLSTGIRCGIVCPVLVIARHRKILESLRLTTLDQVKRYHGELIKNHRGHRDIFRIKTSDESGRPLTLFLKRNLKPYRKDGLRSLFRHGQVRSSSREEWENSEALARAGFATAPMVAFGEDCGLLWERYSCIITEAAPAPQTLDDFAARCRHRETRIRLLLALADWLRRLHEEGLATPDLFARHIFVDPSLREPEICLIDMARLDRRHWLSDAVRARDLAALHVSLPLRTVGPNERLRFLKRYAGGDHGRLARLIRQRTRHLLKRRRFRKSFYRGS